MITKWRVENFKSLCSRTELDFGPVTLFAGANSSGKSTLIQSMLLVGQTVTSRVLSQSVVLNGNLVKLGQFNDLKSLGSQVDKISIGWECAPSDLPAFFESEIERLSCDFEFDADADAASSQRQLLQVKPRLGATKVVCITHDNSEPFSVSAIRKPRPRGPLFADPAETTADLEAADSLANEGLVEQSEYDIQIDNQSLEELRDEFTSGDPVGCRLRHFVPLGLTVKVDERREIAKAVSLIVTDPTRIRRLPRRMSEKEIEIPATVVELVLDRMGEVDTRARLRVVGELRRNDDESVSVHDWNMAIRAIPFSQKNPLRERLSELAPTVQDLMMSERSPEWSIISTQLPSEELRDATAYLSFLFTTRFRYLGPLRDEPKPLYPISSTADPLDIGLKGEHTAAVLHIYKESPARYIPSRYFENKDSGDAAIIDTLEHAISDWLKYLDVAESIATEDKGKFGHELTITVPGMVGTHDLTHVGVGVSQVLPILVMCLLAPTDTTLVFEQPELHLHPKVQTRLADFFLSMALLGKQCIIETHSEYLVNRFRLRVAKAVGDQYASLIKTYFVEKRKDVSFFRPVRINKYGSIDQWPEGFFDEAQREEEQIILAATRKLDAEEKQ